MLGNWGLGTESANASVSKAKVLSGDSEGQLCLDRNFGLQALLKLNL